MSKPILIHIGWQKTGSTYLQRSMFAARDGGFANVWMPENGRPIEQLVLPLRRQFSPEAVREQFWRDAAAFEDLPAVPTISDENLVGMPHAFRYYESEVADRIAAAFPEARILIVVREQKSLIRSLYGEMIRANGITESIETFIGATTPRTGFAPRCRLECYEYDYLVKQYQGLFAPDRVLVLAYETLLRDPIHFEQRIHDFAGTGLRARGRYEAENVGFGAATLELARRLNRYVSPPPRWGDRYRGMQILDRAKTTVCHLADRHLPRHVQSAADRRIRDSIERFVGEFYAPSNRRLAAMSGVDLADLGYDVAPVAAGR